MFKKKQLNKKLKLYKKLISCNSKKKELKKKKNDGTTIKREKINLIIKWVGQNMFRTAVKSNIWIRIRNALFENECSWKTRRIIKRLVNNA